MAGDLLNIDPNALSSTIEFLTAMVTPTLLISATGSLVLSTSTRLGRVVDRARELENRLSELITVEDKSKIPLYDKRLDTVVKLLDKVTTRSRILQKALKRVLLRTELFYFDQRDDCHRRVFYVLPLDSDSGRHHRHYVSVLGRRADGARNANGDGDH